MTFSFQGNMDKKLLQGSILPNMFIDQYVFLTTVSHRRIEVDLGYRLVYQVYL